MGCIKGSFKWIAFALLLTSANALAQRASLPAKSVNVLAIGNAHYPGSSLFPTFPDINYSASTFLKCFAGISTISRILTSSRTKALARKKILQTVRSFVDFVESRPDSSGIALIYYCGHGIANLSGSAFFVPGDITGKVSDTTFEFLSSRLLNIDEITHIIINAQAKSGKNNQYIILADCCSDKAQSKWYKGLSYHFVSAMEGSVTYNDTALQNMMDINSALRASAGAYLDSAGNVHVPPIDSTKPVTNEFSFVPELIRSHTFQSAGNKIIYSSPVGEETAMVPDPGKKQTQFDVGPICRRTVLYFQQRGTKSLQEYLQKLTVPAFDSLTAPALIDRSRNEKE